MKHSKFYFFQFLLFIIFTGFFLIFIYLYNIYPDSKFSFFLSYTFLCFFLLLYFITKIQTKNYLPLIKSLQDLQKGYFNIYLPIEKQDPSLQPLAHEISILSNQLKIFEHLRIQRIQFEQKKFEILAQNHNQAILIMKDKKVIYMNDLCLKQVDLSNFFSDYYQNYNFSEKHLIFIEDCLKTDGLENESFKSISSYGKLWPLRTQEQDYYLLVLYS